MMPVRKSQNWLPNIFNDFFGNEWLARPNSSVPAVNIIETDDEFKVEVAAPGLTKEDFRINISEDNELVITMEHRSESSQGDDARLNRSGENEQQDQESRHKQSHQQGTDNRQEQAHHQEKEDRQEHSGQQGNDSRQENSGQQDQESRQGASQAQQSMQHHSSQQGDGRMQQRGRSEKKGTYLRREFSYTQFQQSMILPDNIDKDGISASVTNGVLTIDIPKKKADEKEKGDRQIEIR